MIDEYNFGRIVIDGKIYTSDVIIFPDRVRDEWWREDGHSLSLKDIKEVLARKPDILIIGTGSAGLMRVPFPVVDEIRNRGIKLIIEKTGAAVQTYNRLYQDNTIVGAFHLTC